MNPRKSALGPPRGSLAARFHLAVLVPLPIVAALYLQPAQVSGAAGPQADRAIVNQVLQRPFLTSDLEEIAALDKAMSRLQNTRQQQLAELDALTAAAGAKAVSPLNLWDRIARTARRHKAGFDFFLGFSY